MDIKYFELPKKHLIIDDYLTDKLAEKVLKEFIGLETHYEQAAIGSDGHVFDGCDQCIAIKKFNKFSTRDNKVVYINDHFKGKEYNSIIINAMNLSIGSDGLVKLFDSLPGIFPILKHVNTSEAILSRYGKCDFYGIHNDPVPGIEQRRILTFVYYVNKVPIKFEGGNLIMYSDDYKEKIEIEPKHNRCVVFESKTYHAVDSVTLSGAFDEGRFSVNFWVGFDGTYKFKE